jgi:predicted amidophosphoribosyltransferase
VIDDVMTTGTTLAELAATLLAAGASEVHAWCATRTPDPAGVFRAP